MRLLLLLALLACSACGLKKHHDAGPFADVAGSYNGTVTSVTGIYTSQVSVGHVTPFTISDSGVVTTHDSGGAPISYQLIRTSSDFTTQHRDLGGGDYEVGNAPFSVSTVDLAAWNSSGSVLGTESMSVVKLAGG